MGLKFLVTGGLGHIGSELIRQYSKREDIELIRVMDNFLVQRYCSLFDLPKTNVKFEFIEGDISKEEDLKKALRGIDVVIHLASITDAPSTIAKPQETERINFEGTRKILNASIEAGVKTFLFPSSTSVYGETEGIVDETFKDFKPSTPYAETKLASERLLQEVGKSGKIKTIVLRCGTIFGTSIGMRFHTAINRFCYLTALDRPITVWDSALNSRRPYLGLNDCIRAFEFLEKNGISGEVYNVVTENYSMGDVIDTIKKVVPETKVEITKSPIINQKPYHASNKKIISSGFEFKDSLEMGVRDTLKLFSSINNSSEKINDEESVIEFVKSKDLSELKGLMDVLSEKVYEFRKKNNSLVPLNVFKECLMIGGISSTVELLIEVFDGDKFLGYALKKRDESEADFHGQYHIPGTVVRLNDDPDKIFSRIEKEISKMNKTNYLQEPIYFGLNICNETERKVVRTGLLYIAKVDINEAKKFDGNWGVFEGPEEGIVKAHKEIIKWIKEKNPQRFFYLPPN